MQYEKRKQETLRCKSMIELNVNNQNKTKQEQKLKKLNRTQTIQLEEIQKDLYSKDNSPDNEIHDKNTLHEKINQNNNQDLSYKNYRIRSMSCIQSVFNENELKYAPFIFKKHSIEIQRKLKHQMNEDSMIQQVKENENIQQDVNSKSKQNLEHKDSQPIQKSFNIMLQLKNLKKYIYILLERPMMTKEGQYLHYIIQAFIILSVAIIISDSLFYNENKLDSTYNKISQALEIVFFIVFLIEFLLRLISYNSFGQKTINFFKQPLNIFDLLSLLPFIIDQIILETSNYYQIKVGTLRVIRIVRLVRIVRIFKISRYLKGLDTLIKSLNFSKKYFSFVSAILLVFILFFSTIIYYFEKSYSLSIEQFQELGINPSAQIKSIPQSLWFSLTTLTTLGYGDKLPLTFESKICAGLIVLVSQSFVIGLPIAIVGFDFSNVYSKEKEEKLFNKQKNQGIQISEGSNQKIKELLFMQDRLKKISMKNQLVRELSSRTSKMCYLITKDLVGLYQLVEINEKKEFQKIFKRLKLKEGSTIEQLEQIVREKPKIKMENLQITKSFSSYQEKDLLSDLKNSPHNKQNNLNNNDQTSQIESTNHEQTSNYNQLQNFNQTTNENIQNNTSLTKSDDLKKNLNHQKEINANIDIGLINTQLSPTQCIQIKQDIENDNDIENQKSKVRTISTDIEQNKSNYPQEIQNQNIKQMNQSNLFQIIQNQSEIKNNIKEIKMPISMFNTFKQIKQQQLQQYQQKQSTLYNPKNHRQLIPDFKNQLQLLNQIILTPEKEENKKDRRLTELDEYNEETLYISDENIIYQCTQKFENINSNRLYEHFEKLSLRRLAQIKLESYQSIFNDKLYPGELMKKINKQGSLNQHSTFIKNLNISKECIDECNEEDEKDNSIMYSK